MREWFIDIVITKIIIILIHQRWLLSDGSRNFSQINRFSVYTICVGDPFAFVRIVDSFRARRIQWMNGTLNSWPFVVCVPFLIVAEWNRRSGIFSVVVFFCSNTNRLCSFFECLKGCRDDIVCKVDSQNQRLPFGFCLPPRFPINILVLFQWHLILVYEF